MAPPATGRAFLSTQFEPRALLTGAFHAAVEAVRAEALLPQHLPPVPAGRLIVIAVGKAAADMVACVERHWPAQAALCGLGITRHGHGLPTRRIRVVEAGHPLPDGAGVSAAAKLLEYVRSARTDDHVLALISGGGSSLLTLPADGLSLADVQTTAHDLLNSGAPISAINCVRKHLSLTLGGRLAASCTAPVTALLLSDVVGDDPGVIASGPFAPDPSTFADALDVLRTWRVLAPKAVMRYLQQGADGLHADTPKLGDACFARVTTRVIGNGATALEGAAAYLRTHGLAPMILGDRFAGEARDLALDFAAQALQARHDWAGDDRPRVLLSGGETQVTVRGQGRGGRNGEFLLALALALQGAPGIFALAADTDGIDGAGDNAGAIITPDTLARARALGLDAQNYLNNNDAYGFFAAQDALVITGPTMTNANDFRAILLA